MSAAEERMAKQPLAAFMEILKMICCKWEGMRVSVIG
jgi:hypothetical protein